jgi:hypothetical protein
MAMVSQAAVAELADARDLNLSTRLESFSVNAVKFGETPFPKRTTPSQAVALQQKV